MLYSHIHTVYFSFIVTLAFKLSHGPNCAHMTPYREIDDVPLVLLLAYMIELLPWPCVCERENSDYATWCQVAELMWRELDPLTIFRKKAAEALVCQIPQSDREWSQIRQAKILLSVQGVSWKCHDSCEEFGLHMQVDTWKKSRVHTVHTVGFASILAGSAVLTTADMSLCTQAH